MLRNLNTFLKNSERILSEMNNTRKDVANKGVIRNMKQSPTISNSQKYGNYFLDASLHGHNLPTFEGCEGDLFINAAYLAVYSLHERSLRKFVSDLIGVKNELNRNADSLSSVAYSKERFKKFSYDENLQIIHTWISDIDDLSKGLKKNNHNISTLETLFSEMSDNDLEDIAINLIEVFAEFVLDINKPKDYLPFRIYYNSVKSKLSNDDYVKKGLTYGYHDRTTPLSYWLLSIFSEYLHKENVTAHWIYTNKKDDLLDSFKMILKDKYPNRREQIYSIFSDYIMSIIESVYIINYSTVFYEVYNSTNQVVIFEGADNLGKSTLIENIIDLNPKEFYAYDILEKQDSNLWKVISSNEGTEIDSSMSDIKRCTLKFHGYPEKGINTKPKLSYIQYFSKYKWLPGDSIYARQFANLQNIVSCTMQKMEEFFTSKDYDFIYEKVNELNEITIKRERQRNANRVLLQDRSTLSTIVYSINPESALGSEPMRLTKIIQNYLGFQYFNSGNLPIVPGTESINGKEFRLEKGNYGPLDFVNVYENMLQDETIIANSKLHPGCANFIKSKFVFLESDSPFNVKLNNISNKTRKTITETIPEALENVVNEMDEEVGGAKDVWEKSGLSAWKIRNQNYKAIYQAYLKNRIYDARETYHQHTRLFSEKFPVTVEGVHGFGVGLSEVEITVQSPKNMVRFRKDDVTMYDPKDYTKYELAELASTTIFN